MSNLKTTRRRAFVRRLDGEYLELTEVAEALGMHPRTLHSWREHGPEQVRPTHKVLFEGNWVYLYTPAAAQAVREYRDELDDAATRPPLRPGPQIGRRRMWDDEELADRNRRNALAAYYQRRERQMREQKRRAEAREYGRIARQLRAALRKEAAARRERIYSV
jgi:hypothetical protein